MEYQGALEGWVCERMQCEEGEGRSRETMGIRKVGFGWESRWGERFIREGEPDYSGFGRGLQWDMDLAAERNYKKGGLIRGLQWEKSLITGEGRN